MHVYPFCSLEEAKANAVSLCRALEFYEVRMPNPDCGAPIDIGLQRTQMLMAKVLGYARWENLVSVLGGDTLVRYFDRCATRDAAYRAVATQFARYLGVVELVSNIEHALSLAAYGCSLKMRKAAYRQLDTFPCKTVSQWRQLIVLEEGYSYASRYRLGWSTYQIDMLNWDYRRKVAEVLGTKPPRKPRKPRSR